MKQWNRRFFTSGAAAAALGLGVFVGCGGDDDQAEPTVVTVEEQAVEDDSRTSGSRGTGDDNRDDRDDGNDRDDGRDRDDDGDDDDDRGDDDGHDDGDDDGDDGTAATMTETTATTEPLPIEQAGRRAATIARGGPRCARSLVVSADRSPDGAPLKGAVRVASRPRSWS